MHRTIGQTDERTNGLSLGVRCNPLVRSVVVLGLGPWPWDVLQDKFLSPWPWPWKSSPWPWPWPWAKVLGLGQTGPWLAGLVICQTNNTATMLKKHFHRMNDSTVNSQSVLIKCLLHELMPPLSYFFLVLCSLAHRNLKRSLNVFWCQVLGLDLEAQVLVNDTVSPIVQCIIKRNRSSVCWHACVAPSMGGEKASPPLPTFLALPNNAGAPTFQAFQLSNSTL